MPPAVRQRLRRKLKTWYAGSARDLPWRATQDAYRIWISEIMLQQTTVAAVVPYYERFFEAFPTLETLANAEERQVLKLWEGLGYYSRARNLWKAARQLWEHSEGQFPSTVSELQELPGIGRYTAGAIVSFAFNRKAPILEANTVRLYSRLIGYESDPRSAEGQRILWRFAEQILPQCDPGRTNQALMELGARICAPSEPSGMPRVRGGQTIRDSPSPGTSPVDECDRGQHRGPARGFLFAQTPRGRRTLGGALGFPAI
jgi:A/G-specific adenine glycosylase